MPFDLTLSPGDLGRKYRAGRVLPIPFTLTNDEPLAMVRRELIQFAFFLPAGVLIAGLPGWIASGRYAALRVLVIGVALAGAIEAMQLIIFTRYCDSTDIVTGSLAVLIGWRLMRYFLAEKDARRTRQARLALLVGWVGALAFIHWEPFDFRCESAFVSQRWHEMSFVPFADYDSGNYLLSFSAMLDEALLFVPFGFLLASIANVRSTLIVVVSALLLASLLETGKFFLSRHSAGISDLILATSGAWLGCLLVKRLPSPTSIAPSLDAHQPR
jgi:glycopeptide antibiotics resistance protein